MRSAESIEGTETRQSGKRCRQDRKQRGRGSGGVTGRIKGLASEELTKVCAQLAKRYPPDWYERLWGGIHLQVIVAVTLCSAWLFAEDYPGVVALSPMLVAHALFVLAPAMLWKRHPMTPRWAHPSAKLSMDERLWVAVIVQQYGRPKELRSAGLLPVNTGDQLWLVMRRSGWIK